MIDIGEVLAVQLVELAGVGGMVLGPVPPVPVAALRDQQLLPSELADIFVGVLLVVCEEIPRLGKIIPSAIVLGRANPNVEVGVDPGARDKQGELGLGGMALDGLGTRHGL